MVYSGSYTLDCVISTLV